MTSSRAQPSGIERSRGIYERWRFKVAPGDPSTSLGMTRVVVALVAFAFASCATDRRHQVIVSIPEQRMALLEDGAPLATYPVSTSKFGLGDIPGSSGTPLGALEVAQKIGGGAPSGAVFKDRRRTGEIVAPDAPGRDPIVTRILWLRGEEPQNALAYSRFIYIHGTPEERNIGLPVSHGCIRMRSLRRDRTFRHCREWSAGPDRKSAARIARPGHNASGGSFVSTHNFAPSQIR